jgi:NitT/TauT family transport system permease protein
MNGSGSRTERWRFSAIVLPAVGVVAAVGLWWLAAVALDVGKLFLPAPPALIEAFTQPGSPEYFLDRSLETLAETVIGFVIAMVGGFCVALLLTTFRTVEHAAFPVLVGLNAVPKVALAPLLVVWLGFEIEPKIVMVVLICFFPIVVATMAGLASTPADLGELASSLSASRWQTYLKVRLPWALPQIFVGLKVSMPLALIGAVVAETTNPNSGLGSTIVKASQQGDTAQAFVCLVLLAMISIGLYYVVAGAERLLLPWARAISAQKV